MSDEHRLGDRALTKCFEGWLIGCRKQPDGKSQHAAVSIVEIARVLHLWTTEPRQWPQPSTTDKNRHCMLLGQAGNPPGGGGEGAAMADPP